MLRVAFLLIIAVFAALLSWQVISTDQGVVTIEWFGTEVTTSALFGLLALVLIVALALPLGWAHSGVFWGVFVSETAVGVFTLWLFSRGRWKTVRV